MHTQQDDFKKELTILRDYPNPYLVQLLVGLVQSVMYCTWICIIC
jgi:hypothetical protein